MSASGARSVRDAVPGTAPAGGLRRRPTGAPPPLPRKLGTSGKGWLAPAGLLAVALVAFALLGQPLVAARFETWILRSIASVRADWLTPVMRVLGAVGTGWSITVLGWGMLALLMTSPAAARPSSCARTRAVGPRPASAPVPSVPGG